MASNNPFDFKKPEDVQDYLKLCFTEYSYQCHAEKDPLGCQRLANFYEIVKKDLENAVKVSKMNCYDHDYGNSCFQLGRYHCLGQGGLESNRDNAFEAFKRGCDAENHHGRACEMAGSLMRSKNKPLLALEFYEKGCSGKELDGVACLRASNMYLDGKSVEIDHLKALEFSKLACKHGQAKGCYNAAVAYKLGNGVPVNMEMFEFYKKKYIERTVPVKVDFS